MKEDKTQNILKHVLISKVDISSFMCSCERRSAAGIYK